jgi:hypothetical protein
MERQRERADIDDRGERCNYRFSKPKTESHQKSGEGQVEEKGEIDVEIDVRTSDGKEKGRYVQTIGQAETRAVQTKDRR